MASIEDLVLLPRPRTVESGGRAFEVSGDLRIVCRGSTATLFPSARRLQDDLWELQRVRSSLEAAAPGGGDASTVSLVLGPEAGVASQGYSMNIDHDGIEVIAADAAGAHNGAMTLRQMLRQSNGVLPGGRIDDHPDLASRGVMLDVSRDKVPTLETLFELVDMLSEWKVNHLELYTEHTFAYRNHREVWAQASPYTADDMLRLDAFCRERFVELVPNQNSFGHMHRWLELPSYNHLAESPGGAQSPWDPGRWMPPFSLDPTNDECLKLLDELYDELLPNFTSEKFNVGCDETFELGLGRSKDECERRGKGRVYLDFLLKIHDLVTRHGRRMHFWGDIIIQYPELVPELPRDVVVLGWGYEADHPFDEHCERLAASGIPFYVCPGTSSWNTITGRTDNCIANVRSAAANGVKHGAVGLLNTDWGDNGHTQYLPISYLGFAAGAALSWCEESNRDETFVGQLDVHAFRDRAGAMGRVAYDLGNTYLQSGRLEHNASALFGLLSRPLSEQPPEGVTRDSLRATADHIASASAGLVSARMDRPDAEIVKAEFANAARMSSYACERGLAALTEGSPSEERKIALARDLRVILGEHRRLWAARNRVGGLNDGIRSLEQGLEEYAIGS